MAQIDEDGTLQCRVRIWGHYQNKPFVYTDPPGSRGSQFYHLRGEVDEDGDEYPDYSDGAFYEPGSLYPSKYWWAEGNMSCDINRAKFVGADIRGCGDDIYIDFIQPLEPGLTTLCLMESIAGVIADYEHEEWRAALEKGLEGAHVIEPRDKYWGLGVK